ncbi:hypothetical protein NDU88_003459 [Pleurodeles waltl]|uniref:Uncharacterized protein n=1 Tax=Pleurodeles waltl TaxID=8319 RepID=A0AAV7SDJ1_PLEWA|nr:hypothetical protein NDU88_003459 [Pleurodeles waltl]
MKKSESVGSAGAGRAHGHSEARGVGAAAPGAQSVCWSCGSGYGVLAAACSQDGCAGEEGRTAQGRAWEEGCGLSSGRQGEGGAGVGRPKRESPAAGAFA